MAEKLTAEQMAMNHTKVANVLNAIRSISSPYYQQMVPEYTAESLLNNYANFIFGKNVIENEFIEAFENIALYEATKQHIFENEFTTRFKNPVDVGRAKTFETFVNPVNPLQYDGEALDRILKLYKRDVKTCYFYRNRKDIFPVSLNYQELQGAFQSESAFITFIEAFYLDMANSNAIVEYNAIKQLFATNTQSGALITVNVHGMTPAQKWKLVKSYMKKMAKPSTQYNNYINIEGATGEPVTTSTPTKNMLLIPASDFIVDVENDVLAAAFQLTYAEAIKNIIEVDDFGYNIYDRVAQRIVGHEESDIQCVLCDEAILKFDESLNTKRSGENIATLTNQNFWHVWQTIALRPWCNCVVFVDRADEQEAILSGTPDTLLRMDRPTKIGVTDLAGEPVDFAFTVEGVNDNAIIIHTDNGNIIVDDLSFDGLVDDDNYAVKNAFIAPMSDYIVENINTYNKRSVGDIFEYISTLTFDEDSTLTTAQVIQALRDMGINENSIVSVSLVVKNSNALTISNSETFYYTVGGSTTVKLFDARQ